MLGRGNPGQRREFRCSRCVLVDAEEGFAQEKIAYRAVRRAEMGRFVLLLLSREVKKTAGELPKHSRTKKVGCVRQALCVI